MAKHIVKVVEQTFGVGAARTAEPLADYGEVLHRLGRLPEAIATVEQVLKIHRVSKRHASIVARLVMLAKLHGENGACAAHGVPLLR